MLVWFNNFDPNTGFYWSYTLSTQAALFNALLVPVPDTEDVTVCFGSETETNSIQCDESALVIWVSLVPRPPTLPFPFNFSNLRRRVNVGDSLTILSTEASVGVDTWNMGC